MFAVDNILISDELLDAPFACNLAGCLGGCCVQGHSGAPVLAEEREALERALPVVAPHLRPEALRVIERDGVWESTGPDRYATTCVGGAECVFVVYDGRIAKCSLQQAFHKGKLDFEKPISCHLYPLRIEQYGDLEVINYQSIPLCSPARRHGRRTASQLADYLRVPLERRYGSEWYQKFTVALDERRKALGIYSEDAPGPAMAGAPAQ